MSATKVTEDAVADRDDRSDDSLGKRKHIEKAQLAKLPRIFWSGPVEVLDTPDSMKAAVDEILAECSRSSGTSVLGFDTETRPCFRKGEWNPTALVQLATADRVYLFRICKNPNSTFSELVPLLESATILKCGVGIALDVEDMLKVQRFTPRGFYEIRDVTRPLGYVQGGLRNLAGLFLGGRVLKNAQMSNWARYDQLNERQILYAATDAWLGRELYLRATAEQVSRKLPPVPPSDILAITAAREEKKRNLKRKGGASENEKNNAALPVQKKQKRESASQSK